MRRLSRGSCFGAAAFAAAGLLWGQSAPSTPEPAAPAPAVSANPTTPSPTPTIPSTPGGRGAGGGTTTTAPPPTIMPPRPIFVSGRVILHDGGDLPERATIERLCSTNAVRSEGYTDAKGNFAIQLGQNQMTLPDASTQMAFDPNSLNGLPNTTSSSSGRPSANAENPFWDCELRARLPGYRSTSVLLAGRKPMDPPDIGQIVLYPISAIEGRSVSVTSALAPRDAKKAYEKGLNAGKKNKPEEAEKEFRKAVGIYPKYAEAWTELGKLLIERKQYAQAREALNEAVAADSRFVFPHEQLYVLAFEEANWQELADRTDRLLRLNPYDFVGAYYFNGVANMQLRKFEEAEKSLREALGMDFRNQIPKIRYVLGLVLVGRENYVEAAEHLRAFAKLAPNDTVIPKVNSILTQLENDRRIPVAAASK
jgi:tetratricopeptide (TPR) repeat protein